MEINKDLIVSQTTTGNTTEIVIKKHKHGSKDATYLSEVFTKALPSGLVHKDETGMGATHLELIAKRNSIIVEPIKVTASSKAKDGKAFYVGSETKHHTNRVTVKDIQDYISSKKKYKKIVVVADSLYKVTSAIGKEDFKKYFLLIDEIDSFQMDASFRSRMENVIDTYKLFPANKRAMVSATPLAFSDPELAKEPVTYIRYDNPTSRNINLFYTENIWGAVVVKITELLAEHPQDKIMVAFNSVSGCFNIIKHITTAEILKSSEISMLCSASSRRMVEEYYTELAEDTLPSKLNFVTSAYFTGFDLKEKYHLISVSSNENEIYSLSDKRLKQIAGRCRETLLSETILYDLVPFYKEINNYTTTDLINAALTEIKSLECIKKNFLSNAVLQQSYDKIRDLIIANTHGNEYQYVRNKAGEAVVSYLNIDAHLESSRVQRELYCNVDVLPKVLRDAGHNVTDSIIETDIMVQQTDVGRAEREMQAGAVIELLKDLPADKEPINLVNKQGLSLLQKDMIEAYHYLYQSIENEQLLSMMSEAIVTDRRSFNNLIMAAFYATLDPEEQYKRVVRFHIPAGNVFTNEELMQKWNDIFVEMNIQRQFTSETKAVRFTKLHCWLIKRRNKNRKVIGHFIKTENPYDFKIINYKPIVNHQTEINYIFKKLF